MEKLKTGNADNADLTDEERIQLEKGLRVLARIIVGAYFEGKALFDSKFPDREGEERYQDSETPAAGQGANARLTMSVGEAAEMLGLSKNATYEAIHAGQIPHLKVGSRYIISRAALMKMIRG